MPIRDVYIDVDNFKKGLFKLEDTTKAPFGSARVMRNVQLTDRGGIGPRPGTQLLGTENTNTNPVLGLYNFRQSFDQNEFLLKAYDDEMEVYSKNQSTPGWFRLKNGYTANKEFGFVTSLVNVDNQDYCIFCNRFESYQSWTGAVAVLDGALAGGETDIQVDSVFTDEIFDDRTAVASSSTTLDILDSVTTNWGTSQWVNLFVYIKSGAQSGQVRPITANTDTQITFSALPGDPGNCDFEIRMLKFERDGNVIYNGTEIAYTPIVEFNKLPVTSAHAAPDGTPVAQRPVIYHDLPRGNRLTNYLSRIIVGKVRSAIARDDGGALQGFASGGSYFVSKITDPFDFDFSAARIAGEGDIVGTPYGGGEIEDVAYQEDTAYIFKPRYIEAVSYSQDANDLAVREPLKAEVGSVGRVIKGSDDIYFMTDDNRFTSIGRVRAKDIKPHTENIGHNVKRLLDEAVFGTGRGIENDNKIYIPHKESSESANNDKILIYNKDFKSFEGIWDLNANFMEKFDSGLYYGESIGSNVYQMLTGRSDVVGSTRYPISSEYATHFMNFTASKANLQALNSMYFEGYIRGNTTVTFQIFKDFADNPFLEFDFSGTEEEFLEGNILNAFIGGKAIGLSPIGSISDPDPNNDGLRHFQFTVFFPFQYGNYFSVGFKASGEDYEYDVIRFGLGLKESVSKNINKVKTI